MSARILVTGGTGFLGSRIVERLVLQGRQVRVLARAGSDTEVLESLGAEVIRGDLGDELALQRAVKGCGVVCHAGARVETRGEWEDFSRDNVSATEKLLGLALAQGVERFVHVSSLGIFDIPRSGITIEEDSPYDARPLLRGHYTRSKIHADRVATAAARRGAPVTVIRPGILYGPGKPLYMGRLHRKLGRGLLLVVGSSSYLAPLCYVDNAADAVVMAARQEGGEAGVFNVVDNPGQTHADYFRVLGKVIGPPFRVAFLPVGLLVPALSVVSTALKVLKRRQWAAAYQLRRSGRSAVYATGRAREILGWKPRVGLSEALECSVRNGLP